MILRPDRPRNPLDRLVVPLPPPPPPLVPPPPAGRARRRRRRAAHTAPDAIPIPYLQGLYRLLPPEQVEDILRRTRRCSQRRRRLPAAAVLWLVIGLGFLPHPSIPKVWRAFHPSSRGLEPSDAAFSQARARLGPAPLRHAFERVAQPMATPLTQGAFYRGWRLMAWDGTVLDLPDTPDNARIFGRPGHAKGQGALPQLRLLALCELGTHTVCAALVKPIRCQEGAMADTLIRHLRPGMLLLWDRAFLGYARVIAVRACGAHILARVKVAQLGKREQELPDGSYLCRLCPGGRGQRPGREGVLVRVIDYTHDDPARPGCGQRHRLMTTVLDPAELPAAEAPLVYHERWEEELVIDEIKTHLSGRALLVRSKSPAGVVQEVYGLLLAHYVIRAVMHEAALASDMDPDRLSFTNSVWVVRYHLPEVMWKSLGCWYEDLVWEVSRQELRPRRERWYPRVLKKTQADYPKKRAHHQHPPQPRGTFAAAVVPLGGDGTTVDRASGSG
jgi:transposase IS4-like protein/DDE family transposase